MRIVYDTTPEQDKAIKRENAVKGMPVPLHPGAAKYYKEVGLIK